MLEEKEKIKRETGRKTERERKEQASARKRKK